VSCLACRAPPAKGENIVVLKHAGQKAGLVVDTLLGEFQTVIKPLGQMFSQVQVHQRLHHSRQW
jgi:two-component system chemotaxis sensor kinase CheA